MAVSIVRLGSERLPAEGLRIGTVRRPPRGVPKRDYASGNWYDVWLPMLSPEAELMKQGRAAQTERQWSAFLRRFRTQMKQPEAARLLDLLAALSHSTDFSVGCYCEQESRCHRAVLRALLQERGACLRR
jgi:uncharacterized protein YeaO (DUF488 family)